MDPICRVVTGHDARGRAIILEDRPVDPVTLSVLPGFETIELWHTEGVPAMPDDLGASGVPRYFPSPGGSVFRVVTFPPESQSELAPEFDFAAGVEEAQAKVPDLVARLDPDDPGMHATDSVDYGIVLEGELEMELDDGVAVVVRPGTVIVQRGTRHAWRNRTDQPARVAFVLIGATPAAG